MLDGVAKVSLAASWAQFHVAHAIRQFRGRFLPRRLPITTIDVQRWEYLGTARGIEADITQLQAQLRQTLIRLD